MAEPGLHLPGGKETWGPQTSAGAGAKVVMGGNDMMETRMGGGVAARTYTATLANPDVCWSP